MTVSLIYKDENVDATVNAVIADHRVFWWNPRRPDEPICYGTAKFN